jgi:hypothetical protein
MIHVVECDAFWNSAQTKNGQMVEEEKGSGGGGQRKAEEDRRLCSGSHLRKLFWFFFGSK